MTSRATATTPGRRSRHEPEPLLAGERLLPEFRLEPTAQQAAFGDELARGRRSELLRQPPQRRLQDKDNLTAAQRHPIRHKALPSSGNRIAPNGRGRTGPAVP